MSFFTLNLSGRDWSRSERLAVKGQIYLDSRPITADQLVRHLTAAKTALELTSSLERLNGFYAWVCQRETIFLAGVDHVRSWPLFYGQTNGQLYLGDNAEWVRQQVGDTMMAQLAREEFLLAGYVTGGETLYPNVKQLQAGEYLQARARDGGVEVITRRYFRFWHIEPAEPYDENQLQQTMEQATIGAMRRLVEYADGRQIVVPLSGGYDSRLIVTELKRIGYENIVCFSYGVPGNKDSVYSRRVADALELKWFFADYSESLWRRTWRSPEAEAYRHYSANHSSLPHVQDWLAIKVLLENEKISPSSVVVPGHTGDFIAGGHIPRFVFRNVRHTERSLLESLVKNHLSNAPKTGMILAVDDTLHNRLRDRVGREFDGGSVDAANLYELWDWQERQSKYIVNSVRVYDYFGLHWWLPLWDLEFLRVWESVPLKLRKERVWYKKWVSAEYSRRCTAAGHTESLGGSTERSPLVQKLVDLAGDLPRPIHEALRMAWRLGKNTDSPLALEGLVTVGDLKKYLAMNYNIIGICSELYIGSQW